MKKKYRQKIGFIAFLPLLIILSVFCIPWFIWDTSFSLFLICLLILQNYIFIIPTYYIIDNEQLIFKSGLFHKIKIDISTITKITETNKILSTYTFAPSLDRIKISYKKYDHITISPKNKHNFIQDLMSINPDIEVIYKEKTTKK